MLITKNLFKSYYKFILSIILILVLYFSYVIYKWSNTESSDNAYLDCDISNISSEVNGSISEIFISDNQIIRKDEIIAKIDDTEYKLKLDTAKINTEIKLQQIDILNQEIVIAKLNLEKAEEALKFADTNLKITKQDYDRVKTLNLEKFSSKKLLDVAMQKLAESTSLYNQKSIDLEQAKQQLLLLAEKLKNAHSALNISKQEEALAKFYYNNTIIKSPIDGIVSNISLRIGSFVRTGSPLASIVPTHDQLYVKANFKETQLIKIVPGMLTSIKFDGIPGVIFSGKIRSISPATGAKFSLLPPDNATGNFTKIVQRIPVFIDIVHDDTYTKNRNKLTVGMSSIISIYTNQ